MAPVREIARTAASEEEDHAEDDEEESETRSSEEDQEEDEEEEEESAAEVPKNFERITPVEDTPWAEFIVLTGHLAVWLVAFVIVQMCWWMKMRSNVNLAFIPVSFILVPVAFFMLRGSRHVCHQHVEGLEFLLHWLLRRNWCLHNIVMGAREPRSTSASQSRDTQIQYTQVQSVARSPKRKTGVRYNIGLASCIMFFWVLVVGRACWPCGYLYLVDYSFQRCQYLCKELKNDTSYLDTSVTPSPGQAAWLTLRGGNVTRTHADLLSRCELGVGPRNPVEHPAWSDPHWLVEPHGAWVIGEPIHGHLRYEGEKAEKAFAVDCKRFNLNVVVLVITGLLTLLVGGVAALHHKSLAFLTVATTLLSLLCASGILGVWMGWVRCRTSTLNSREVVFSHLLDACLIVADYNGTSYAQTMRERGRVAIAFESNFRHVHHVSRSEVWFGSMTEAFLLLLVITAHAAFKHKRMQTEEARYELLCRRPKLVKCFLKNLDILDRLPARDRTVMARTLQRVCSTHKDKFRDLQAEYDALMAVTPGEDSLSGVAHSFWPAALYALLRALVPSTYRQLVPGAGNSGYASAVPEENSLWMLSAIVTMVTSFIVYLFVLFQVKEACRHYTRTMQVWLIFDSLWNFPSQCSLTGNALTEIVQVNKDEDGESIQMLDRSLRLIGDFSAEHVSSYGMRKDDVVNVATVRDCLPTWWAWREYLIIDYADKRVRLELHLVVAILLLVVAGLMMLVDDLKEGTRKPDLTDIDSCMSWFEGHVSALTFQTALDLLFLTPPLLHAMHTAATMNRLIESQLQKVVHLAEIVGEPEGSPSVDASPSENGSQQLQFQAPKDELGQNVRNIFRAAKAEFANGGSSATRLLSFVKINRQTFAIAGTTLSVFTGSQFVEIFESVINLSDD